MSTSNAKEKVQSKITMQNMDKETCRTSMPRQTKLSKLN